MRGIADTGFLVAFCNRNDAHHAWAVGVAKQLAEPLLTCEAVLAEAAYHLESVPAVLNLIQSGLVRIQFEADAHLARIDELARKYADRKPDFADLCLVRMSELYPKYPVVTTDLKDFRTYRRGRKDVIALVHP